MTNVEHLEDESLGNAVGGAKNSINTTDWNGAHWQPTQYAMGTTFVAYGFKWYRIAPGDTLGAIAQRFGTKVEILQANNPATIKNPNQIYAGDAIIICRA